MAHQRTLLSGMLLAALMATGCGTVRNLSSEHEPTPYGGTADNWCNIEYNTNPANPRKLWPVTVAFCAVDLPLSVIGDTVTLPYVLIRRNPPFTRTCIYAPPRLLREGSEQDNGRWPTNEALGASSVTVENVQSQLSQDLPIGTSRTKAVSWLDAMEIEHSDFDADFSYSSEFQKQGIQPDAYSGYIAAVIRDGDRGMMVTESIQIYLLFDDKDRIARHIVKWFGTGP